MFIPQTPFWGGEVQEVLVSKGRGLQGEGGWAWGKGTADGHWDLLPCDNMTKFSSSQEICTVQHPSLLNQVFAQCLPAINPPHTHIHPLPPFSPPMLVRSHGGFPWHSFIALLAKKRL